jgi:hypothetical protein
MSELSKEIRSVWDAAGCIDAGRYKEGFTAVWDAIGRIHKADESKSTTYLLGAFSSFIGSLEDRLKKDFDLDVQPEEEAVDETVLRCSGCSKQKDDVQVLIGLGVAYICDECAAAAHTLAKQTIDERADRGKSPL